MTAAVSLTSSYSGRHTEWEEVQYYCIDYFQLYFHLTLALDHLYRQSFRDLHYLSLSSAAVINLALYLSLSLTLIIKGCQHMTSRITWCHINLRDTSCSDINISSQDFLLHTIQVVFHDHSPSKRLPSHYFCIINVIDQNRDLMDGIQGWRALCLSAGSELSQRTN